MSIYWILKHYSPPLTETQIEEIISEINHQIVDPLKVDIEKLKAQREVPKPKRKAWSHK